MSVFESEQTPRLGLQMAKKFAIGGVLIVLFTATAVASTLLLEVHQDVAAFVTQSKPIPGVKNVLDEVPAGSPQTILLLGSDRRFADIKEKIRPRSDTIIVVRLDPDRKATAIMSIPRDLKVDIPGYIGKRKINEAYELGGPKLTVRTLRNLLSIPINHVVNVNFGGFQRAVNRLGCVYADIDRRYYNDNAGGQNYATIDLKPGYQKLCGQDALDYVRFRHEDSDFVRAARQQEFLRQAKEQIGLGKLFGDRQELLRIFGHYTETDISQRNDAAILGLLKLAYESSKTPITEIHFPATDSPDHVFVEISPDDLIKTVDKFIEVRGRGSSGGGATKKKRIKHTGGLAAGLIAAKDEGENHVLAMDLRLSSLGLPVYFPQARLGHGGYVKDSARSYEIFDRNRNRYRAYRIVLYSGEIGQYYGVQGTTWKAPPILDNPTDEVTMRKRTYRRYFDGRKIRLIAWETPKAVYWVSNTLSQVLTNKQMMGIARSLQRIGQ
ncbi:MAG: polyisoprenyl-teichoic acid--peptidoglycan teichoic acid transferase [Solirubrobacteraceae bacterium]|nr:polyisoprenyl-teichoic acid--peptidoglycan teichoic acid transferase [Solirubrobacteraceae bacterium]